MLAPPKATPPKSPVVKTDVASRSPADAAARPSGAVAIERQHETRSAVEPAPVYKDFDALQQGIARDLNTLADANGAAGSRQRSLQRLQGIVEALSVDLVGLVGGASRVVTVETDCVACLIYDLIKVPRATSLAILLKIIPNESVYRVVRKSHPLRVAHGGCHDDAGEAAAAALRGQL